MAHAIIGLRQGLGPPITDEGVERPEQFSQLAGHRGLSLRGFLLARPTSISALPPLLATLPERMPELLL